MDEARAPFILGGVAWLAALAGLALAGAKGDPYLSSGAVNGWLILFAAGLLGALLSIPFMVERRLRASVPDSDRRWERALLAWGAISVAVLLAGFLVGVAAEWSGDSLGGAVGILVTIESVIVVAAMVVWLLSG